VGQTERRIAAQLLPPEGGFWGKPTEIAERTATLMANERVLVAGGEPAYYDTGDFPLSRAELYDAFTGTFTATSSTHAAREGHAATRIGARGPASRQTFSTAADAYIEERALHSAEKSCRTDRERSRPLKKAFGDLSLKKIAAQSILEYQKTRIRDVSARTVNLEVGLLRRILKKNRAWARIADDVRMLPELTKEARVLTQTEKEKLLEIARTKPEWQVPYCAAILALNTTCRSCELRGLRWNAVDWADRTITIRRSSTKTNAGARVIRLNADALIALMELRDRADKLQKRETEKRDRGEVEKRESRRAEQFVFPSCEHGHFDANRPMKNWRTGWRALTRAISCPSCGTIQRPAAVCKNDQCHADIKGSKSEFGGLRFHDLRHQAITETGRERRARTNPNGDCGSCQPANVGSLVTLDWPRRVPL
jgi:integrase